MLSRTQKKPPKYHLLELTPYQCARIRDALSWLCAHEGATKTLNDLGLTFTALADDK